VTRPQGDATEVTAAFGRQVHAARLARGWSLRHLGSLTGMSCPNLSRVENGGGVSLAAVGRIAAVFGVPVAHLVTEAACGDCLDVQPRGFTCDTCGKSGTEVTR
jgi:transcriptional regulator with XRE-family HTH domain